MLVLQKGVFQEIYVPTPRKGIGNSTVERISKPNAFSSKVYS